MVKVLFEKFGLVNDDAYKFAVICAKYQGKWIFCRHKQRTTWEIPGGHRESGETVEETARRELYEETGASVFDLIPLSPYCVDIDGELTYAMLFFADIKTLGDIPSDSEIKEVRAFDTLPDALTYPQIQPHLHAFATEHTAMCYSYVMGMEDAVLSLIDLGFDVKRDGENYTVCFSKHLAPIWERFVTDHLQVEYWNEYFAGNKVVFIFRLQDGIQRHVVENYEHAEVLSLCEKLCGCTFASIKDMLFGNWFYRKTAEGSFKCR